MEMTMRWYGSKFDTVTLKQIRQTAYVTGVITMLYDKQPGELWTQEEIHALKEEVEAAGLHISGIESVNVSDAIKTGSKDRDKDIDTYIKSLENLGKEKARRVHGPRLHPGGGRCDPPRGHVQLDQGQHERFRDARLGAGAHGPRQGAVCNVQGHRRGEAV